MAEDIARLIAERDRLRDALEDGLDRTLRWMREEGARMDLPLRFFAPDGLVTTTLRGKDLVKAERALGRGPAGLSDDDKAALAGIRRRARSLREPGPDAAEQAKRDADPAFKRLKEAGRERSGRGKGGCGGGSGDG